MPQSTPRVRRLLVIGFAFAAAIISCGREVTGPNSTLRFAKGIAWNAIFPQAIVQAGVSASTIVPFTKVRVVLRHADNSPALDQTIDFPSDASTVPLNLTVALAADAPASGEQLTLTLEYLNATGDVVFKGGPSSILAVPADQPAQTPVSIPVSYSGPGSAATTVTVSPHTLNVNAGGTFSLTAAATSGATTFPNTPIVWSTDDATRATLTSAAAGAGTVSNIRGTVHITAQLLTGPTDVATITVVPVAASVALSSGNNQTGTAGGNLTSNVAVLVKATDGLALQGTTVNFAAAANSGSAGSATAVSDVNGIAQTTWKLGTTAGTQTLTASVTGLTGSPVTFTATATPAVATKLVFTTQPPATNAAATAIPAIVVTAQDANGNTATGFTGDVTLALGVNSTGAALGGTLTATSVAGVATFSTVTVNKTGTGYTLVASTTNLTSATTTPFDILTGAAAKLAVVSGDAQSALVSTTLPAPIIVQVTDLGGNPVAGKTVTFATSSGTTSPASGVSSASGNVSVNWTLGSTAGPQTLVASSIGLTSLTMTATANSAVAGPATQLAFSVSPSNAVAGAGNSPSIVVQAKDAGGLLATTFTGNVTLAIGTNPGASTIGGTVTVAAIAGVATFPGITLNKTGTGYTLVASSGVLTNGTSATFNIAPAAAANFAKTAGDGQTGLPSSVLPTPVTVKVTDAFGNGVLGASVSFGSITGGGSLGTTSILTDVNGLATSVWTLGATLGAQTVTASSGTLTGSPAVFTATASGTSVRTWTGATSTAWTTTTNWSPVGVPTATDSVIIISTTNEPTLASATTIKALQVNSGATLTLGCATITINGTMNIVGSMPGCGGVVLTSPTVAIMQGTVGPPIQVSGIYNVTGTLSANSLQVLGAGSVDINGQTVGIAAGGISTAGTAVIKMTSPSGILTTTGGAAFQGGSETGFLTAGTLTVGSNFSQDHTGGANDAFNAGPAHTTILNGSVPTNFSIADPNTSNFGNLMITNTSGVTALTGFIANNLTLTTGVLSGTNGGTINGIFTDPLTKWAAGNISFATSTNPIAATTTAITPNAQITFNNNPTILAGNLTVNGAVNVTGNLQLNGHTLTVTTDFATSSNGQLTMSGASDIMNVAGNVSFGSTGVGGPMTAGTMNIGGNFSQSGNTQSISASGTNTLNFNGAGTQTVTISGPDGNYTGACSGSCVQNVTVNKATGALNFLTAFKMLGNFTNTSTSGTIQTPVNNGPFIVVGNAAFGPNGTYHRVGVGTATYSRVAGTTTIDSVSYFGTGQSFLPTVLGETYADIRGTVNWSTSGTLIGQMVISGTGQLNVSTAGANITGNFSVNGASSTLKMTTNASDSLHVHGNAVFGGGNTNGLLTAGYFIVDGNLDMGAGNLGQYSSTAGHTTVLGGSATQTILLNPAQTGQGFYDVWVRGAGVKNLANAVVYAHDVNIGASASTVAGLTWSLSGKLTDTSSTAGGAWRPNATNFTAAPSTLPLNMNGTIAFKAGATTLSNKLYVGTLANNGSAQVVVDGSGTTLALGGHTLRVDTLVGVFTTSNSGALLMTNAVDTLKASDYFFGGSSGTLNNGVMQVYGNFTQQTSSTAFQATGSHLTYLMQRAPGGHQISFANPGLAGSHFADLYHSDTAAVTFLTDVDVEGEFETGIASFHTITSANKLLTSRGADVRDLAMNNTRWLLVDGENISDMDVVQFNSMTPTATYLEVQRTGAFSSVPFTSISFNTAPTTGLYLKVTDTDGATNGVLNITMSNTSPPTDGGFSLALNGATISGWGSAGPASWLGGTSSNWSTAANWSTGVVPTATTDVTIPSGTTFLAQVTANSAVKNLTLANSAQASLTGGTLTINGDLSVGTGAHIDIAGNVALIANGNVTTDTAGVAAVTTCSSGQGLNMNGTGKTVTGRFCNLYIAGNTTASGVVTVNGSGTTGNLSVTSGNFAVNGKHVFAGQLGTINSGTITENNPSDSIVVTGNTDFSGGNTSGLLTAGYLNVGGNFSSGNTTAFQASGSHLTILFSGSAQSFSTGAFPSTFNNLYIKSAGTRTSSAVAYVLGNMYVGASVTSPIGGSNISLSGNIYDSTLVVGGAVQVSSVNLRGSTTSLPGIMTTSLAVVGSVILDKNLTLLGAGNIDIFFQLKPNGHTLTNNGYLNTAAGTGFLEMTNAADNVIVGGNTDFSGGGDETGHLTNGTLDLKGNFNGGNGSTFIASGSHTIEFSGNSAQSIGWAANPNAGGFQNVLFNHDHNRSFTSDATIFGDVTIFSSDTTGVINGAHRITSYGTNGILDQSVSQAAWQVGATSFGGSTIPTYVPNLANVDTTIFAGFVGYTLPYDMTAKNVSVEGGPLNLNGHKLKLGSNSFQTSGTGYLKMITLGDSIGAGPMYFNGGSTAASLTTGIISADSIFQGYGPGFAPIAGNAQAFAQNGGKTYLKGGGVVAFANAGTAGAGSHVWYLSTLNSAATTFKSNVFVDSLFDNGTSSATLQSDNLGTTVWTLTANAVYYPGTAGLAMKGVNVVLNGTYPSAYFQNVNWSSFPASYTGTLFTQNRTTAGPQIGLNNYSAVTFSGSGGLFSGAGGAFVQNIGSVGINLGSSNSGGTGLCVLLSLLNITNKCQ